MYKRRNWNKNRICVVCKKKYIAKNTRQKYCSEKCFKIDYIKKGRTFGNNKKIKCKNCGKLFTPKNRTHKFCSIACGRSVRNKLNLHKPLVREYFLERANFRCEECGEENNNNLELHHIKPLYKGGYDNIDNIIVLCRKCHLKKHKIKI